MIMWHCIFQQFEENIPIFKSKKDLIWNCASLVHISTISYYKLNRWLYVLQRQKLANALEN